MDLRRLCEMLEWCDYRNKNNNITLCFYDYFILDKSKVPPLGCCLGAFRSSMVSLVVAGKLNKHIMSSLLIS